MSGRNFDNFLELLGAKVFSSFLMTSVHVLDFEKCNYHNNRKHGFKNVQKCSPVDNTNIWQGSCLLATRLFFSIPPTYFLCTSNQWRLDWPWYIQIVPSHSDHNCFTRSILVLSWWLPLPMPGGTLESLLSNTMRGQMCVHLSANV